MSKLTTVKQSLFSILFGSLSIRKLRLVFILVTCKLCMFISFEEPIDFKGVIVLKLTNEFQRVAVGIVK